MDFYLYRAWVTFDKQALPFRDKISPTELLDRLMKTVPFEKADPDQSWHIGNVDVAGTDSYYFRIGRTTLKTKSSFVDGKFIDEITDDSPSTHAFIDIRKEIVALGFRSELANNTDIMARKLADILSSATLSKEYSANVEINPISDPEQFVAYLLKSDCIHKFWYSVSKPNADDVDMDYVAPVEAIISGLRGDDAKVIVDGKLEPRACARVTESVATTGGDAGATLSIDGGKPEKKRLKGSGVISVAADDVEIEEKRESLMQKIIQKYFDIRKHIDAGQL